MDPSALESVSRSLESSLDWWGWWLLGSTFVVAIGLVLEYWHPVSEFIVETKRPMSVFRWDKLMEMSGAILITVGVMGEFCFTLTAFRVEGKLRENNHRIVALLTKEAGDAKDSAKNAKDSAESARDASDKAIDKAGEATTSASDALVLAGRLNRDLLAAKAQLERVENTRAELERSLINLAVCNAPRILPLWAVGAGGKSKTSTDPLKPFAGTEAIIEAVPDAEARRAALNIARSLDNAGWKVLKLVSADGIDDGVEVQNFMAALPDNPQQIFSPLWQGEMRSIGAADAVVDFLHSYNWETRTGFPLDEQGKLVRGPLLVPEGGLRIRVGLYPPTAFVSPPGAKDMTAAVTEMEQRNEKGRKQMEEQQNKRDAEILKNLTAQARAI